MNKPKVKTPAHFKRAVRRVKSDAVLEEMLVSGNRKFVRVVLLGQRRPSCKVCVDYCAGEIEIKLIDRDLMYYWSVWKVGQLRDLSVAVDTAIRIAEECGASTDEV